MSTDTSYVKRMNNLETIHVTNNPADFDQLIQNKARQFLLRNTQKVLLHPSPAIPKSAPTPRQGR